MNEPRPSWHLGPPILLSISPSHAASVIYRIPPVPHSCRAVPRRRCWSSSNGAFPPSHLIVFYSLPYSGSSSCRQSDQFEHIRGPSAWRRRGCERQAIERPMRAVHGALETSERIVFEPVRTGCAVASACDSQASGQWAADAWSPRRRVVAASTRASERTASLSSPRRAAAPSKMAIAPITGMMKKHVRPARSPPARRVPARCPEARADALLPPTQFDLLSHTHARA